MAGMTPDQLRRLFAQEAEGRLAELGQLLLRLEQNADDETLVRSIFRELHTLKGSAAVAGLDDVSRIAHDLEELAETLRDGGQPVTSDVIDTLLQGADQLSTAIGTSHDSGPIPPAVGGAPSAGNGTHLPQVTRPQSTPSRSAPPPNGRTSSISSPVFAPRAEGSPAAVIRVPLERLEELARLVGETASAHLRLGRMLKDRFKIDPATCAEYNEQSRLLNDLQDRVMRTQMVPVSTITDQLHRAVRDLSRAQGKDVRWEAQGTDTELDRGILHKLSDSLMHLVRNAVDHGLELPDERHRAGKRAQGTIRLRAMQLGSDVILSVTDDGRGIDVDSVTRQAQRRGIDTDRMTEQEVLELTFQPGLSTTTFVTDVSGRGVGLDVVRTNVESAHGRIEMQSQLGAGTEFKIIVPITTAILRCLLVEAGGQRFALPFHRVLLSQAHDQAKVWYAEGRAVIRVEEQAVPVQGLAETLGLSPTSETSGPLVVLADGSRRYAFQVDSLIGQRDVHINALNPLLPHLPAVAGASVEPDGSVLVVLDPPGLIQRASRASRVVSASKTPLEGLAASRRSILVVDDALTIRELQRAILVRAGFDVRVATDGNHALSCLAEAPSDLVLTDIEMPNMGGFALTEAIRAHPTLANIPVLILSSSSTDEDRQRGLDAGADGFIQKGGFDQATLLSAVNQLLGTNA
jgi:two-component system chemotaxis sensor kinase CheA